MLDSSLSNQTVSSKVSTTSQDSRRENSDSLRPNPSEADDCKENLEPDLDFSSLHLLDMDSILSGEPQRGNNPAGVGDAPGVDPMIAAGAAGPSGGQERNNGIGMPLTYNVNGEVEAIHTLYVGNLDPNMTEQELATLFSNFGPVSSCKIIRKQLQNNEFAGYAFIEYVEHEMAERALLTLDGQKVHDRYIKVNWANTNQPKDLTNCFTLYVGDISADVDRDLLARSFAAFGTVVDARVLKDIQTGASRGYGFVSYRTMQEAQTALSRMNGQLLGQKQIRVNWATQKDRNKSQKLFPYSSQQASAVAAAAALGGLYAMGIPPLMNNPNLAAANGGAGTPLMDYGSVLRQTTSDVKTVYVGNLPSSVAMESLRPFFDRFHPTSFRMHAEKNYCFVEFPTHELAASAIVANTGIILEDKEIKCAWASKKPGREATTPITPTTPAFPPFQGQGAETNNFGMTAGGFGQYAGNQRNSYSAQGLETFLSSGFGSSALFQNIGDFGSNPTSQGQDGSSRFMDTVQGSGDVNMPRAMPAGQSGGNAVHRQPHLTQLVMEDDSNPHDFGFFGVGIGANQSAGALADSTVSPFATSGVIGARGATNYNVDHVSGTSTNWAYSGSNLHTDASGNSKQ